MWSFGWDATTGATIWATIALVIFIGVAIYFGIPKTITKMLDGRIKAIEDELAEAERLRMEAKFLLEEYESKRLAAASEAESIVAAAREEAFRLTAEAKSSLEALIARRTKAVEDKIAQAESQAPRPGALARREGLERRDVGHASRPGAGPGTLGLPPIASKNASRKRWPRESGGKRFCARSSFLPE